MYTLAIFDFDGTLADTLPWFAEVFNGVADRYRFRRIAPGELEALRGVENRALMRHLGISGWKVPFIAAHMRKLAARDAHRLRLFDGAAPLLRRLHDQGVTVAIVSSNTEANVRRVLGAETAGLVAHYACGASIFGKHTKFRAVLARAGVPAGRAIAIGDEIRDIHAARRAGIACGAVTWGFALPDALKAHRPDAVFERFEEIAERMG
ncbi:HAD hydrolase-like protein [Azospirillum sp. TSO22-1]|uniref:HAD hydrolase-like protein n=1 Tax=Azospirillum sp. TSO22-1 TaxID=716789 RepID=UPI0018EE764F|nr:HAD hydrolase-like protein [Azospirillum sp. TSO22-1]